MRQQLRNLTHTLRRQTYGSYPFMHADWIKLMIAAVRFPLRAPLKITDSSAQVPAAGSGSRLGFCRWELPHRRGSVLVQRLQRSFRSVLPKPLSRICTSS